MWRKLSLLAVGLAGGLVLGLLLYPALANKASSSPPGSANGPATLSTRGRDVIDAWPVARSWAWTVNPSPTKRGVGVCIRTVESEIPPGKSPFFPSPDRPPPKGRGTERHSGWDMVGGKPLEGKVVCQVIDLGEVGLAGAEKRPIRLLVRLTISGGTLGIWGDESILEGEDVVRTAEVEPQWTDDEMHLLTVNTRTGNKLFSHYVLLVQDDPA